jgi:predicted amidohydrolase
MYTVHELPRNKPNPIRGVAVLNVAVVQMSSEPCEIQSNLEKVLSYLHQAAQQNAQLILFPECVLTGYDLTQEEAEAVALSPSDDTIQRLHRACSDLGVILQVGTLERADDGRLYNSAFLIGPEGLFNSYKKTHLPVLGLDRFVAPGALSPAVIQTPLGRLGSLICYDLRFPEPSRLLALDGTQIMLVSTAWPQAASLYADFLAQARAAENRVFLMAANRCGQERSANFLGRSLIIDPEGNVLQEADSNAPEILLAEIEPTEADRKHLVFEPGIYELDLIGARRPELYRVLTR